MGNETFYWDGLTRADKLIIHSQREIDEIFDPEKLTFSFSSERETT